MDEPNSGDVMVCIDCYIAHHYGATCMSREANGDLYGPWTADERADLIGEHEWVWFAGESDTPCESGEPLRLCADVDLWDATCSDHDGTDDHTWFPLLEIKLEDVPHPCTHCKRADYDNGLYEFSWSSCQGCGSGLGGARYRLRWTERTSS